MQIFSFPFAFPAPRFARTSHKKGFPLSPNKYANWSKSTQQKQADAWKHPEKIETRHWFMQFTIFSGWVFFFLLEQNSLERHIGIRNSALNLSCLFRAMTSEGPVLSRLFSFPFISGELLYSIWVSLYQIFQLWSHYTDCCLLLSLHLLRFRPEYGVLVAGLKLQVSGSLPVEP